MNFSVKRWLFPVQLLVFLAEHFAVAQENESIATTNFRPGHNVTLTGGLSQGRWSVRKVGAVERASGTSIVPILALRYTFHMNLLKKFGLIVGTGSQFLYENQSYSGFVPGSSFVFPSLTTGVVQNFIADARVLLGVEYSGIWFPWMKTRETDGRVVTVGAVPDLWSVFLQLDKFQTRNRALSVSLGWKKIWNSCSVLTSCRDDTLVGSLKFENMSLFVQTGLTWQVGEELGI
jgi:hypothetical protein